LYGEHGANFVSTMLRVSRNDANVSVVSDQTGQATWTKDLSEFIVRLVRANVHGGYYHDTHEGEVSGDQLARRIFELAGLDPERIVARRSSDLPLPAQRPPYSVLAHDPDDSPMRPWTDALREYVGT
jgi:dTDP-4-dehydrorhamnose reductase